ncbi:MAG: adenosylhomocysteinase [Candidatus Kerfeldbacteria bacterium]|nr:adenosylhomocysteinase [Candidatus Kerfeldbacteria bacterium]
MKYDIRNIKLATAGKMRINWAERQMNVLRLIRQRFRRERPLRGVRVAGCLHVTTESAVLIRTLKAGGASVVLCASNPLSTQDDTAAAIVRVDRIPVFAKKGEDRRSYYRHLNAALDTRPHVTMDDGADLVSLLHSSRKSLAGKIYGSTEETTTGVIRLRSLERKGLLRFPVMAVNDSRTKHYFDNRYGTGQSTIDGILRSTNILVAGKTVVVAGYGWCGKGVAARAHGLGANVIVTEVNPVRALEALLDGYRVMRMTEAASLGDIFVTVTGNTSIIGPAHVRRMKNGAIIGNSGHFDVEIDVRGMARIARRRYPVRPFLEAFELSSGRTIYLIAAGRLLNLAAAEGHPAAVMDMSFANQALAVEYLVKYHRQLKPQVYTLPDELDMTIARLKLASLGTSIDRLTPAQRAYLSAWELGT